MAERCFEVKGGQRVCLVNIPPLTSGLLSGDQLLISRCLNPLFSANARAVSGNEFFGLSCPDSGFWTFPVPAASVSPARRTLRIYPATEFNLSDGNIRYSFDEETERRIPPSERVSLDRWLANCLASFPLQKEQLMTLLMLRAGRAELGLFDIPTDSSVETSCGKLIFRGWAPGTTTAEAREFMKRIREAKYRFPSIRLGTVAEGSNLIPFTLQSDPSGVTLGGTLSLVV